MLLDTNKKKNTIKYYIIYKYYNQSIDVHCFCVVGSSETFCALDLNLNHVVWIKNTMSKINYDTLNIEIVKP